MGGELVTSAARPGAIVPVDSEHSALAQALRSGSERRGAAARAHRIRGSVPRAHARQLAEVTPEGGPRASDLGHGARGHDELGDPREQGTRGHRGAPAVRRALRRDRGDGASAVDRALDGRVRGRVDDRPGEPARHAAADLARPRLAGPVPGVGVPWTGRPASRWTFEPLDDAAFLAVVARQAGGQRGPPIRRCSTRANEEAVRRRSMRGGSATSASSTRSKPSWTRMRHSRSRWKASSRPRSGPELRRGGGSAPSRRPFRRFRSRCRSPDRCRRRRSRCRSRSRFRSRSRDRRAVPCRGRDLAVERGPDRAGRPAGGDHARQPDARRSQRKDQHGQPARSTGRDADARRCPAGPRVSRAGSIRRVGADGSALAEHQPLRGRVPADAAEVAQRGGRAARRHPLVDRRRGHARAGARPTAARVPRDLRLAESLASADSAPDPGNAGFTGQGLEEHADPRAVDVGRPARPIRRGPAPD